MYKSSNFSTFLPKLVIVYRFYSSRPSGYLFMVLLCIYLMAYAAENLFTCLLAICEPSLEICLFRFFVHFSKLGFLSFYYWVVCVLYVLYLNLLDANPLSDMWLAKLFSHFCAFFFFYFIKDQEDILNSKPELSTRQGSIKVWVPLGLGWQG